MDKSIYDWHDVDPYSDDDSDCPTIPGWYEVIDIYDNNFYDVFHPEPFITDHGIGYWKHGKYPIKKWRKLKVVDGELPL